MIRKALLAALVAVVGRPMVRAVLRGYPDLYGQPEPCRPCPSVCADCPNLNRRAGHA